MSGDAVSGVGLYDPSNSESRDAVDALLSDLTMADRRRCEEASSSRYLR